GPGPGPPTAGAPVVPARRAAVAGLVDPLGRAVAAGGLLPGLPGPRHHSALLGDRADAEHVAADDLPDLQALPAGRQRPALELRLRPGLERLHVPAGALGGLGGRDHLALQLLGQ